MKRFLALTLALPISLLLTRPRETKELNVVAEVTYNPIVVEANAATMEEELLEVIELEEFFFEEQTEENIIEETTVAEEEIVTEESYVEETEAIEETVAVEEEIVVEDIMAFEEWIAFEELYSKCSAEEIARHTGRLTAKKGYVIDSPCGINGNYGSETWYPDSPVGAVKIMERENGFRDLKMTVREDGVRILSGTRPNGETFSDLVVVAADTWHRKRNPNGIFNRGDLIETSLGLGIVVDYCERADNEREQSGHIHIDIATNWYQ